MADQWGVAEYQLVDADPVDPSRRYGPSGLKRGASSHSRPALMVGPDGEATPAVPIGVDS